MFSRLTLFKLAILSVFLATTATAVQAHITLVPPPADALVTPSPQTSTCRGPGGTGTGCGEPAALAPQTTACHTGTSDC
ncbi:hypothetical protein OH77DRAFT_1519867 [Trametes cingulata]|nr:hypothetical protein OH77DRAFT_1519867 [Trametes cingulata]